MKMIEIGNVARETKGSAQLGLVNDGGSISTKYFAVKEGQACTEANRIDVFTTSQNALPGDQYDHCAI
jgi:hypothetical protein